MALYRGDPGRRGCSRPGRARLVQRVHVPVELRRVVGYLDPDVAGIDLASRLKASSITAWTFSGLTGGLTVMRSVTPATPLTLRTIRSTSCRWYSYSTSPSSVTHPSDTRAWIFPSGTCTFHSRMCAIARARSESSHGAPDSLTFRSLATALTPYTRSAARAAASRSA